MHAGEAAGADSVREALDVLGAERIGHGVRAEESPEVEDVIRRRGIVLEMCPCSNVQTRATASLANHPIHRFLRRGLRVTVGTDARTVSDTTLTSEFEHLAEVCGWGSEEFWACQRHAAEAAFVSADASAELLRKLASVETASESRART